MEVGHAFTVNHAMASLSREGASLASRGTPLGQVAQLMLDNGGDINMDTNGGAIVSRMLVDGGVPVVLEQESRGSVGAGKVGAVGDSVSAAFFGAAFADGRMLYSVEVYYDYQVLTPLAALFGRIVPTGLYERSVF